MSRFSIITIIIAAALSASCSTIKEDRIDCATYLTIDVDAFIAKGFDSALVSYRTADGSMQREPIDLAPYKGIGYEIPVERGSYAQASVIAGIDRNTVTDDSMIALDDSPFDPVWAFVGEAEPTGDLHAITAVPHKQYCKVTFRLAGNVRDGMVFPYTLRVHASFNGFGIFDLQPRQTDYTANSYEGTENSYSLLLPRQGDNDISLDIIMPGDDHQAPGQVLYVIELGKRFRDAGYDWTKESLDDIDVTIDFSRGEISITVNDWTVSDRFSNVEI